MSYFLEALPHAWAVDRAILREEQKLVVVRFGVPGTPECSIMDRDLEKAGPIVRDIALIYTCDIEKIRDFNELYELYDNVNLMFFHRNKHMMIDLGTGDNNKITCTLPSIRELVDIIEVVYRGALQGKGLVSFYKNYNTKLAW